MMDKAKGVMTALKGRTGFDSKKGVALLGIVQKLTAKRKALGEEGVKHEMGEMKPMKKHEMPMEPLIKKVAEKRAGKE